MPVDDDDSDDEVGSKADETSDLPTNGVNLAVVKRVIRHLTAISSTSSQKAYSQGNVMVFRYLCDLLDIEHVQIESGRKKEKQELFAAIQKWVRCWFVFRNICILTKKQDG